MVPNKPSASSPFTFDQQALSVCFQSFKAFPAIALAVSGGADSVALLLLVRRWLDTIPEIQPDITVLTVDHELRPESAEEARWVQALAKRLKFQHHTLHWQGSKPRTGIQAAARKARYDLMTGFCRDHAIPALATAHQAGDQAETFLMRLRRGSGVDGLAAMASLSKRNGIVILRPLLDLSRAELSAFLTSQKQSWREDPSNADLNYERIQLRRALSENKTLGLTASALNLTAKRLSRARRALEGFTTNFLRAALIVHDAGFGTIPLPALLAETEEIGLRALIRMAHAFGGCNTVRLAKAEAALEKLRNGVTGLTLGGCHFALRQDTLTAVREYGRMPKSPVPLAGLETVLWDNRFLIESTAQIPPGTVIRPLGPDGIKAAKVSGYDLAAIPRAALLALPSFWKDGTLVAAPFLEAQPDQSIMLLDWAEIRFQSSDDLLAPSQQSR